MKIAEECRREAYYEIQDDAPTRRKVIYQKLRTGGPMTAESLMAAMGFMDPNQVRPRLTELRDAGLIREAGKAKNRNGKKRNGVGGCPMKRTEKAAPCGANTESGKENNATNNLAQGGREVNGAS